MYILWSCLLVAAIIIIMFGIYKSYNPAFWKLLRRDPSTLYAIMKEHPDIWIIGEKDRNDRRKTDGPFFFLVPELGKPVRFYGVRKKYKQHQIELVEEFKNQEREEE